MKHQLLRVSRYLFILSAWLTATVFAGTYDSGFEAFQANQLKTALDIWSPLAKQGNADAQFGIGVLYNSGSEIEQNSELAFEWFSKAADQGYAGAQFNLGNEYKRGVGLTQDNSKATHWWRKPATESIFIAPYLRALLGFVSSKIFRIR